MDDEREQSDKERMRGMSKDMWAEYTKPLANEWTRWSKEKWMEYIDSRVSVWPENSEWSLTRLIEREMGLSKCHLQHMTFTEAWIELKLPIIKAMTRFWHLFMCKPVGIFDGRNFSNESARKQYELIRGAREVGTGPLFQRNNKFVGIMLECVPEQYYDLPDAMKREISELLKTGVKAKAIESLADELKKSVAESEDQKMRIENYESNEAEYSDLIGRKQKKEKEAEETIKRLEQENSELKNKLKTAEDEIRKAQAKYEVQFDMLLKTREMLLESRGGHAMITPYNDLHDGVEWNPPSAPPHHQPHNANLSVNLSVATASSGANNVRTHHQRQPESNRINDRRQHCNYHRGQRENYHRGQRDNYHHGNPCNNFQDNRGGGQQQHQGSGPNKRYRQEDDRSAIHDKASKGGEGHGKKF
jgi:DNA-binding transcriptional MerR regulator